jgi:hypothetical protein
VSGGKRVSDSRENAEIHSRLTPRCSLLVVRMQKMSERLLIEYSTAVRSDDVVLMGASSVPLCATHSCHSTPPLPLNPSPAYHMPESLSHAPPAAEELRDLDVFHPAPEGHVLRRPVSLVTASRTASNGSFPS